MIVGSFFKQFSKVHQCSDSGRLSGAIFFHPIHFHASPPLCIIAAVKNNYPKESAEGAKHKLQRPKPKRFGLQETTFGSSRQNNQGQ